MTFPTTRLRRLRYHPSVRQAREALAEKPSPKR